MWYQVYDGILHRSLSLKNFAKNQICTDTPAPHTKKGKIAEITPPPIFADITPHPHLWCKFFHFETYVPKLADGQEVGGVKKSKNSTQLKKSKKCVIFHLREESDMNFTQTKKSKKCVDFHARDDSEEMLRTSFHAREEIEEILGWRVGIPIFCQLSVLAVRDASLMSLYTVEIFMNSI